MPVPLKQDIAHYRGDTLTLAVRLWENVDKTQPCDLSAAVVRAQIRVTLAAAEVVETFTATVAGNTITLALTAAQTAVLPASAVYDCEVDWTGDRSRVQTVVEGKLTLKADVTHD